MSLTDLEGDLIFSVVSGGTAGRCGGVKYLFYHSSSFYISKLFQLARKYMSQTMEIFPICEICTTQ